MRKMKKTQKMIRWFATWILCAVLLAASVPYTYAAMERMPEPAGFLEPPSDAEADTAGNFTVGYAVNFRIVRIECRRVSDGELCFYDSIFSEREDDPTVRRTFCGTLPRGVDRETYFLRAFGNFDVLHPSKNRYADSSAFSVIRTDLPGTEPFRRLPFLDVLHGAWYAEAVERLADSGCLYGVGHGLFLPRAAMTRAAFVAVLYRLDNCPVPASSAPFRDVADGAWYRDAVSWAAEHGIGCGVGNGCFLPERALTREEMAVFLARYAAYAGRDCSPRAALAFSDADDVSLWARDALSLLCGAGWLTGSMDLGTPLLAPRRTATRGEAAVVLWHFINPRSVCLPNDRVLY